MTRYNLDNFKPQNETLGTLLITVDFDLIVWHYDLKTGLMESATLRG